MNRQPLPLDKGITLEVLKKAARANKLADSVRNNVSGDTDGQVYVQDVPVVIEMNKGNNEATGEVELLSGNQKRIPGISDFLGYQLEAGMAQVYTGIQLLFGSGADAAQHGKVADYTIQADHANVGAVLQNSTLEIWVENTLKEKISIADMLDFDVQKEVAGSGTAYAYAYPKSAASRVFWTTEYGVLSGDKKMQFKIVPPEGVSIPGLGDGVYRYYKLRFIGKQFSK